MPVALQKKPDLKPHLKHVWDLFWELSETRPPAFSGVAALLLSEFLSHAGLYQFTRLETQESWHYVRVLDRAYRSYQQKWQEENAKSKPSAKKPPMHKA